MRTITALAARVSTMSALVLAGSVAASAQTTIGPVSWQLQPYCNVVTLTLYSGPSGFSLEGTDNMCGATNQGSAVGVASPNAAGNYTFNFTIVTAPTGKPVHVSAIVSPANGAGTWSDSLGNSGTFAFFGNTPGLPARPQPASGVPAATITATEIAPGAVGAASINPAQVQARVTGACAAGQAVSGINADGTVTCQAAADYAGAMKEVTFLFASVPASGTAANQMATLTFTAPVSGRAVLHSRGYCNIGETGSGVEVNIAAGPDASSAFNSGLNPVHSWGVLRIAPGTSNNHQLMWTTRNTVQVVQGVSYTRGLFGRHSSGTAADDCSGTFAVEFFPTLLP